MLLHNVSMQSNKHIPVYPVCCFFISIFRIKIYSRVVSIITVGCLFFLLVSLEERKNRIFYDSSIVPMFVDNFSTDR